MLRGLKDKLRRRVRGWNWAAYYPVLLPHFEVLDEGVRVLGKRFEPLPRVAAALRLCDGTRTLKQVARAARLQRAEVIGQHDAGRLVMWRRQVPAELRAEPVVSDIVISPHPDDAALSALGVAIGDPGRSVESGVSLIVDVFSRTAWSRFPELLGTPEEVQAVRLAEEALVARLLGVQLKLLGLPEALLRGYTMQDVFTATIGAGDEPVLGSIRTAVSELSRQHSEARWYLPLAVGGHVDHRLARDGALAALEEAGVARERLFFYEDLPYAAMVQRPDFSAMIPGRRLVPSGAPGGWTIFDTLFDKREALRVYWSQLTWSQICEAVEYTRLRWWPRRPAEEYWVLRE